VARRRLKKRRLRRCNTAATAGNIGGLQNLKETKQLTIPRELKIKMRVPVPGRLAQESCIVFNEWLAGSDERITITAAGGVSIRLWLDLTCLAHLDKPPPEKIRRMVNVKVGAVLVDVSVVGVREELQTYIFVGKNSPAQQEHQQRLQADYDALGYQIPAQCSWSSESSICLRAQHQRPVLVRRL
jgi:hypothetical protein